MTRTSTTRSSRARTSSWFGSASTSGAGFWKCICGCWCFDVGFSAIGDGPDFNLSDVLADKSELYIRDWKGCDGLVIEKCVTVPGGTIPVENCGTLYEVGCKFELRCCGCCDDENSHLAVAGHENQGEYMFVSTVPEAPPDARRAPAVPQNEERSPRCPVTT